MLGQIPPPPLEGGIGGVAPTMLGPAVPPRPAANILQSLVSQPVYSQQQQPPQHLHHVSTSPAAMGGVPGNRATYHELENNEFEPQFLRTTHDGAVFVPPGWWKFLGLGKVSALVGQQIVYIFFFCLL